MSAICAVYQLDKKPVVETDLIKLNKAMQHHGQDGNGIKIEGQCGLAQQITYLTTESFGQQLPLYAAQHKITLVSHCRLFNYEELRVQLSPQDSKSLISDTELILLAYLKWQLDFVKYLVGEFSIILWDSSIKQLICVTDHFNSRPLYYYLSSNILVVASEISALFYLNQVPRQPNLNKISRHNFMRFQVEEGETYFSNIKYIPPASIIVIKQETFSLKKYWHPSLGKPVPYKSDQEFSEAFQEVFLASIKATTRSHFPICLQLSGGLDSSAIAVTAAKALNSQNKPLMCLSNLMPEGYIGSFKDERNFIDLIEASNIIKHSVDDSCCGHFTNIENFTNNLIDNPQHYQYQILNSVARKYGSRIMLHGTLGELSASYYGTEFMAYLFSKGSWFKLSKEIFSYKKNYSKSILNIIRNIGQPLLPVSWQALVQNSKLTQLIKYSLINNSFIKQYLCKDQQINLTKQFLYRGYFKSVDPRVNNLNQIQDFLTHSSDVFSQIDDSPNSAIYLSNPYLDKRLIEFCLNVPNEFRFKNGYPRSILRLGMQNQLPEKICWRTTKHPFIPNYREKYLQQLNKAEDIINQLSQNSLVQEVINLNKLKELLKYSSNATFIRQNNFVYTIVIPRTIYLAQFLSSF